MSFTTVSQLYAHFDQLVDQDADADILFASSYLRGFIAISACEFGDESQGLTQVLADDISAKLYDARSELTPSDRQLVNQYWQDLTAEFTG
ncbi:MAG: YfcL family protein [Thalassotalea sp.]